MNPTTVNVELVRVEGALLRFVGLLSRRGFEVKALQAFSSPCDRYLSVVVDLRGSRCPHVLVKQIARLYEVRSVQITEPSLADPALVEAESKYRFSNMCDVGAPSNGAVAQGVHV